MFVTVAVFVLNVAMGARDCPPDFVRVDVPTWKETIDSVKGAHPKGATKIRGSTTLTNWAAPVCFLGLPGEGNFGFDGTGRLFQFWVRFGEYPYKGHSPMPLSASALQIVRAQAISVLGKPIEDKLDLNHQLTWKTEKANVRLQWFKEGAKGEVEPQPTAPLVLKIWLEDPGHASTAW